MHFEFPEEIAQKKCEKIVRNTLQKDYINVYIKKFSLKENIEQNYTSVSYTLELENYKDGSFQIEGKGKGAVDALFASIINKLNNKFISLKNIRFEDFSMQVKFKESSYRRKSDAPVEIRLALKSSREKIFYFKSSSTSMILAAIKVITQAVEYLINAELAVLILYESIKDAEKRNRSDLVKQYTISLSEMVKITSYEKVIKKQKNN